jgi:SH3 domain protein
MIMQPALAAKYVSDVLWVSLRSAPEDSSQSIRDLKSGVKLDVLDEAEVEGYLHVKTGNGEEGWIKSRYLNDEPVAAMRVSSLEKELQALKDANTELKSRMSSVKKDEKETDRERKRMMSENQRLVTENKKLTEIAKKPLQLSQENEKLRVENERLLAENTKMKEEYDLVQDEGQRSWFITGAGVLFTGIILGVIFPSLRFRRRSGWS